MRNQNSIIQKLCIANQSITDQVRDLNERFTPSKSKNSYDADLSEDESKLNIKESYNGGSTYGEH